MKNNAGVRESISSKLNAWIFGITHHALTSLFIYKHKIGVCAHKYNFLDKMKIVQLCVLDRIINFLIFH